MKCKVVCVLGLKSTLAQFHLTSESCADALHQGSTLQDKLFGLGVSATAAMQLFRSEYMPVTAFSEA